MKKTSSGLRVRDALRNLDNKCIADSVNSYIDEALSARIDAIVKHIEEPVQEEEEEPKSKNAKASKKRQLDLPAADAAAKARAAAPKKAKSKAFPSRALKRKAAGEPVEHADVPPKAGDVPATIAAAASAEAQGNADPDIA